MGQWTGLGTEEAGLSREGCPSLLLSAQPEPTTPSSSGCAANDCMTQVRPTCVPAQ